jgi:hypothetical protein
MFSILMWMTACQAVLFSYPQPLFFFLPHTEKWTSLLLVKQRIKTKRYVNIAVFLDFTSCKVVDRLHRIFETWCFFPQKKSGSGNPEGQRSRGGLGDRWDRYYNWSYINITGWCELDYPGIRIRIDQWPTLWNMATNHRAQEKAKDLISWPNLSSLRTVPRMVIVFVNKIEYCERLVFLPGCCSPTHQCNRRIYLRIRSLAGSG